MQRTVVHDSGSEAHWLPPAQAWFLVFAVFVTFLAGTIDRQVMAMVVPSMKRDLGFTDEQIGVLIGFGFSLSYTLSTVFVARLGDVMSRKTVLSAGIFIWSLLTFVCGAAKSFPTLLLSRLGVGVGESVLMPTALPMVASAFPPERRSFPIAFCVAGSPAGLVLTPILLGYILHSTQGQVYTDVPLLGVVYGWQSVFLAGGLVGFIALILVRLAREPVKDVAPAEAIRIGEALRHFCSRPRYYAALFFSVPIAASPFYALIAWMPTYLEREFAIDIRTIGMLNGIAFVPAALIGPFVGGWLGQIVHRSPTSVFRLLIWLPLLGGLILLVNMAMPTVTTCTIVFGIAVTFVSVLNIYILISIQQIVEPRYRGQATAVAVASQMLISAGVGPMITGILTSRVVGEQSLDLAIVLAVSLFTPVASLLGLIGYRNRTLQLEPSATRQT